MCSFYFTIHGRIGNECVYIMRSIYNSIMEFVIVIQLSFIRTETCPLVAWSLFNPHSSGFFESRDEFWCKNWSEQYLGSGKSQT